MAKDTKNEYRHDHHHGGVVHLFPTRPGDLLQFNLGLGEKAIELADPVPIPDTQSVEQGQHDADDDQIGCQVHGPFPTWSLCGECADGRIGSTS